MGKREETIAALDSRLCNFVCSQKELRASKTKDGLKLIEKLDGQPVAYGTLKKSTKNVLANCSFVKVGLSTQKLKTLLTRHLADLGITDAMKVNVNEEAAPDEGTSTSTSTGRGGAGSNAERVAAANAVRERKRISKSLVLILKRQAAQLMPIHDDLMAKVKSAVELISQMDNGDDAAPVVRHLQTISTNSMINDDFIASLEQDVSALAKFAQAIEKLNAD